MRAYLPAYEAFTPADLTQALKILDEAPQDWQPLAGGTDLMVLLDWGALPSKKYLNIWGLEELQGITVEDDFVTIGGLTTYTQIKKHKLLQKEFPNLCQAARNTGSIAIQNRGTLAGNIANASPAADSPPALLVYDAEIELISTSGSRCIPYQDFHTGYKETLMQPYELIRTIRLPRIKSDIESIHYYRKVGTRKAQAISKVCFAGFAQVVEGKIVTCRIALASVAPTVVRCKRIESLLLNQKISPELTAESIKLLEQEISPINDVRSTAQYRQQVCENILGEFLEKLSH